uniref:Uncharacterized protein n=1 Tax=Aegilops tauschii subsp. strangulata TaxID=200361 RepID=A0A453NAP7_AEGTS
MQVGTPGRLLDHLKDTKGFSLTKLKYLVHILCIFTLFLIYIILLLHLYLDHSDCGMSGT